MSMFDNIVLDEFTMLDEGKQADEYLSKKYDKKRIDDYHAEQKYGDSGSRSSSRNGNSANKNPKYDTAREIRNHRSEYSDVMPKNKTKSEKNLEKAEADDENRRNKAKEKVDRHVENTRGAYYDKNHKFKYDITPKEYNSALDAANRHLRRHPKTESALMLIAGYESEYAY